MSAQIKQYGVYILGGVALIAAGIGIYRLTRSLKVIKIDSERLKEIDID